MPLSSIKREFKPRHLPLSRFNPARYSNRPSPPAAAQPLLVSLPPSASDDSPDAQNADSDPDEVIPSMVPLMDLRRKLQGGKTPGLPGGFSSGSAALWPVAAVPAYAPPGPTAAPVRMNIVLTAQAQNLRYLIPTAPAHTGSKPARVCFDLWASDDDDDDAPDFGTIWPPAQPPHVAGAVATAPAQAAPAQPPSQELGTTPPDPGSGLGPGGLAVAAIQPGGAGPIGGAGGLSTAGAEHGFRQESGSLLAERLPAAAPPQPQLRLRARFCRKMPLEARAANAVSAAVSHPLPAGIHSLPRHAPPPELPLPEQRVPLGGRASGRDPSDPLHRLAGGELVAAVGSRGLSRTAVAMAISWDAQRELNDILGVPPAPWNQ